MDGRAKGFPHSWQNRATFASEADEAAEELWWPLLPFLMKLLLPWPLPLPFPLPKLTRVGWW